MNQEIKDALRESGVDIEGAMARLMNNEGLFERLLIKFKADPNYSGLKAALEEENYEDAFHYAHTLKGAAGNLGLDKLMDADVIVVEKLRAGNHGGLEEDMKAVTEAYEELMEIIEKLG